MPCLLYLRIALLALALAFAVLSAPVLVFAQISNENRGIVPINASDDFLVNGIQVDVTASSGEVARDRAWREAQRVGWQRLYRKIQRERGESGAVPQLSDATLDSILSAVIIEREQISATRYIATLNLLFDRIRTAPLLGVNSPRRRSPPLLVLPIYSRDGLSLAFERRNAWQRAWAEFDNSDSAIDYVRPIGTGADTVLLNVGQSMRRSRIWWRVILDQYSAADVVIPTATLRYSHPSGAVTGSFAAYFGPDKRLLARFALRAENPQAVEAMLRAAVARLDSIYSRAFRDGRLRVDSALTLESSGESSGESGGASPDEIADSRTDDSGASSVDRILAEMQRGSDTSDALAARTIISIEYPTADIEALNAMERRIAGIVGVESATTRSLALGGISVMQVTYRGSRADLRAALIASGLRVRGSSAGDLPLRVSLP